VANQEVLEEIRPAVGRRVACDQLVAAVDQPGAFLGEHRQGLVEKLDVHAIVARPVAQLAEVALVGVVEHGAVGRRQDGRFAEVLDQDRDSWKDDVRTIADQIRLPPGGVAGRAAELTHGQKRRLEQRGDAAWHIK
jgi:hypothetical protein